MEKYLALKNLDAINNSRSPKILGVVGEDTLSKSQYTIDPQPTQGPFSQPEASIIGYMTKLHSTTLITNYDALCLWHAPSCVSPSKTIWTSHPKSVLLKDLAHIVVQKTL